MLLEIGSEPFDVATAAEDDFSNEKAPGQLITTSSIPRDIDPSKARERIPCREAVLADVEWSPCRCRKTQPPRRQSSGSTDENFNSVWAARDDLKRSVCGSEERVDPAANVIAGLTVEKERCRLRLRSCRGAKHPDDGTYGKGEPHHGRRGEGPRSVHE
jgi:hypothetical protein